MRVRTRNDIIARCHLSGVEPTPYLMDYDPPALLNLIVDAVTFGELGALAWLLCEHPFTPPLWECVRIVTHILHPALRVDWQTHRQCLLLLLAHGMDAQQTYNAMSHLRGNHLREIDVVRILFAHGAQPTSQMHAHIYDNQVAAARTRCAAAKSALKRCLKRRGMGRDVRLLVLQYFPTAAAAHDAWWRVAETEQTIQFRRLKRRKQCLQSKAAHLRALLARGVPRDVVREYFNSDKK